MRDVFASAGGDLFTVAPTTVPEIPEAARSVVKAKIYAELESAQAQGLNIDTLIAQRAEEMKTITEARVMEDARKSTAMAKRAIQDAMDEDNFEATLMSFLNDIATYPYAVLAGPEKTERKKLVHDKQTGKIAEQNRMCYQVRRVRPDDFYWTPNSLCLEAADTFEVLRYTAAQFTALGVSNFFKPTDVTEVLEYYAGHGVSIETYTQITATPQGNAGTTSVASPDNQPEYYVIMAYATICGDKLLDMHGRVEGQVIDEKAFYSVIVYFCGGKTLRATINPRPLSSKPYRVMSYDPVAGSIVGRGLMEVLRPNQEVVNSSVRALRRNMGVSSAPFGEVDYTRLKAGTAVPTQIGPHMLVPVEPDLSGGAAPAFRFQQINSNAQELLAVLEHEWRKADDVCGIPSIGTGGTPAGGVGRSAAGLALHLGSASKIIKNVVATIEEHVIAPMIRDWYNHLLVENPKEYPMADAQVVAKGLSGVIQRASLAQTRRESLQLIMPFAQAGRVKPEGIDILIRGILKDAGHPADEVDKIIPDPEAGGVIGRLLKELSGQQAAEQQQLQGAQTQGGGPSSGAEPSGGMQVGGGPGGPVPGTAQASFDGRQKAAVQGLKEIQ
jgi:hypothetical protein